MLTLNEMASAVKWDINSIYYMTGDKDGSTIVLVQAEQLCWEHTNNSETYKKIKIKLLKISCLLFI